MSNGLLKMGLVIFLGGTGLALTRVRPHAQPRNLDTYTPSELLTDLNAELDDILETYDEDAEVDDADLVQAIIHALGDDDDDDSESDIDIADLNTEMREDGTDLLTVVQQAVAAADEVSLREGRPSWTLATYSRSQDAPAFTYRNARFSPIAQSHQDGKAQVRKTLPIAAQQIAFHVQRTRK